MDISQLEDAGKVIGAIITIFGIVKVFPYMKKIGKFFKDSFLAPIRINKVLEELRPNGGASLRDSVNRIEANQNILSQKFAYSLDQNNCGFFYSNANGDYIEISPGYCRLVGKGEDESLGKRWIYNIHVKDRQRIAQEWKEAVDNAADFESDYTMVNSNEEEIRVTGHASPVKTITGQVIGYFGLIKSLN